MSALTGDQRGKQEDSVQKEMLAASATMRVNVEKQHHRPVLPQNCRHRMTEKVLRKGNLPRGRGPSGKRDEKPWRKYLKGNCTNP